MAEENRTVTNEHDLDIAMQTAGSRAIIFCPNAGHQMNVTGEPEARYEDWKPLLLLRLERHGALSVRPLDLPAP